MIALVGRVSRRNPENSIEAERIRHVRGYRDVTDVRRIECASEDADAGVLARAALQGAELPSDPTSSASGESGYSSRSCVRAFSARSVYPIA